MSRSTRKPIYVDGYGTARKAQAKRRAARHVRAAEAVGQGAAYRKLSNSWDICDFKFRADPTDKKVGRK